MGTPYNSLANGERWYFDSPPLSIGADVVARSISQIARFGGQAKLVDGFVYTVGQHAIKVSMIVETMEALMHDAHEIIIGDGCSPMKKYLRQFSDDYDVLDSDTHEAFARIFKFPYPMSPEVKHADTLMCHIEAFDLMPRNGEDLWFASPKVLAEARALYIARPELRPQPWSPEQTAIRFRERYLTLRSNEVDG